MSFAFAGTLVNLITVLAEVISVWFDDRQSQLRNFLNLHFWMALRQMINQHASPSEAHQTHPTLEHEALIVSGDESRFEGLGAANAVCLSGFPLGVVHSLHMLSQFVLSLELFATGGTEEVLAI